MPTAHTEIETKLMLPDAAGLAKAPEALAELTSRCRSAGRWLIHDAYLDTEDWWFYRIGLACRVRRQQDQAGRNRQAWLTLKQLAEPGKSAVSVRLELSELLANWPRGRTIGRLPGKSLGRRLRQALAGQQIRTLFEIHNQRTTYHVRRGKLKAEVAADIVEYHAKGRVAAEAEIELEARAGRPRQLAKLADALAERLLTPGQAGPPIRSKFQAGLELAGLVPPALATLDQVVLSPLSTVGQAAGRVISVLIGQLVWHEPGVRLGLLPEPVHQMRVTARRLRAALKVFGKVLGPDEADRLRSEMSELIDALGQVRDVDVYLQNLPALAEPVGGLDNPLLALYRDRLVRQRRAAKAKLLARLDSEQHSQLLARLKGAASAAAESRDESRPLVEFAARAIRKRHRRAVKFQRSIDKTRLHRLRLKLKRLRYTCEFLGSLFGRDVRRLWRRTVDVQDALGRGQDAIVASQMLSEFAASLPTKLRTAKLRRDVDKLLAGLARQRRRARKQFATLWPELPGAMPAT